MRACGEREVRAERAKLRAQLRQAELEALLLERETQLSAERQARAQQHDLTQAAGAQLNVRAPSCSLPLHHLAALRCGGARVFRSLGFALLSLRIALTPAAPYWHCCTCSWPHRLSRRSKWEYYVPRLRHSKKPPAPGPPQLTLVWPTCQRPAPRCRHFLNSLRGQPVLACSAVKL